MGNEGKAESAVPARPHCGSLASAEVTGVAAPTYLTTPDALRAGAIITALTETR